MRTILGAAALFFICSGAYAATPVTICDNAGHCQSVNSSGTANVVLPAFTATGSATLSVSNSTSRVALPNSDATIILQNTGATNAFFKLGNSSVTAATTDLSIPAGGSISLAVGANTNLAGITASSTTTFNILQGTGTPALGGGGSSGGGGGGAITAANGAYSSGALVDGADVTLGAKADAKSTATDTTAVTAMQVLKEISNMEQNPASRAVTNAGTFATQATISANASDTRSTNNTINLASANAAYTINLDHGASVVGLSITGVTGSGATLTLEGANDGGTTWIAINTIQGSTQSTTVTADGDFRVDVAGRTNIRLRVSGTGTGTASVDSNVSNASGVVAASNIFPIQNPVGSGETVSANSLSVVTSSDDPNLGSPGTAACSSDTGTCALIALIKRLAQNITAGTVTTSQATSANSISMVTSNDEPNIGVPGNSACATDNGSCTLNALLKRIAQRLTSVIAGVTVTPSSTAAVGLTASNSTGCTPYHLVNGTAGTNNSTSLTNRASGAATLCSLSAINTTTTTYFLKIYDLATAPTCSSATGVKHVWPIPPGPSSGLVGGISPSTGGAYGEAYSTGIGFCVVGNSGADNENTSAATGVYINGSYN
jgi:hypothetical protein